jgi:hypothetical protein
MKNFFSHRHTRYTAVVMVFVWQTHHEEVNEQPNASDKAVCLTVCETEQTATVKIRLVDVASDSQTAPIATCSALTVFLVDLNDRLEPSVVHDWCELPVSIRFLRLTI